MIIAVVVQVAKVDDGLEAVIFTADGDMRQALNNLQVSNVSEVLGYMVDARPQIRDQRDEREREMKKLSSLHVLREMRERDEKNFITSCFADVICTQGWLFLPGCVMHCIGLNATLYIKARIVSIFTHLCFAEFPGTGLELLCTFVKMFILQLSPIRRTILRTMSNISF